MSKSFAYGLIVSSILIAGTASTAFAKAAIIPGQNNGTFAAACERSKTCINWGGGVYTNGDTGIICNSKKCVKLEEDAPARESSNGDRGNDPSGSTVGTGGSKGAHASGAGNSNPASMGSDNGSSID